MKTRGQRLKRALLMPRRYGFSQKKLLENLERMVLLLEKHGVVGTFPITATVLDRHPDLARILGGMETAVHGLNHGDITAMEPALQISSMKAAVEMFAAHELRPVGFRAPYLMWNDSTLRAVAAVGFLYDSSMAAGWSCGEKFDSMGRMKEAMASYNVHMDESHLPKRIGNLVEMPVAVPDDEILIDRLGLTSADGLGEPLTAMTNSAADSGTHLVLQLHPERFHVFREELEEVLNQASRRNAWTAPLRDVAEWWVREHGGEARWPEGRSFALTISGDVDAVTLGDFALRRLGR